MRWVQPLPRHFNKCSNSCSTGQPCDPTSLIHQEQLLVGNAAISWLEHRVLFLSHKDVLQKTCPWAALEASVQCGWEQTKQRIWSGFMLQQTSFWAVQFSIRSPRTTQHAWHDWTPTPAWVVAFHGHTMSTSTIVVVPIFLFIWMDHSARSEAWQRSCLGVRSSTRAPKLQSRPAVIMSMKNITRWMFVVLFVCALAFAGVVAEGDLDQVCFSVH